MPRSSKTTKPAQSTQSSDQSYMSRLKFDPKLLGGWISQYLNNIRIVVLLVLTILLMGTVSYFSLPKRLNPEVEIPIVNVVTILPGASPEDVESLVTVPIENKLRSVEGLDTMTSVSNPNVSVITMQFTSNIKPDKAKDDAQALVDAVTDLPEDAQAPQVSALDFEDQPVWTFAVTSSGDVPTLMNFAHHLEDRLENLSKVDRVETAGLEQDQVLVEVSPEKLQQYGLNPLTLAQAVQKGTGSYPAGSITTTTNSFAVTINPSLTSLEDLRRLQLNVDGQVVSLGELATITRRPPSNQAVALLGKPQAEARRTVTFYVYKTSAVSIDEAGKQIEESVHEALTERPGLFEVTTISNTSEEIADQFADLLVEFRSTIILVFACLLLFLGFRQALISSLTVPLTFLSAFIFMNIIGMSINFLSLFAFLLALGLLVDDTIVVVSAMTAYYKSGKFNPLETGLMVWRDTIVPIWSTTITTIWSFVPLLLSTGIIGEFIKPIPVVVTVTMISSTAIAVFVTLPIMIILLKPKLAHRVVVLLKVVGILAVVAGLFAVAKGNPLLPLIIGLFGFWLIVVKLVGKQVADRVAKFFSQARFKKIGQTLHKYANHGLIDVEGFANGYYNVITRVLEKRSSRLKVIFAIVIYAIVAFALLPLGLVKNEFFPKSDQTTIYVNLELPAGTRLEHSYEVAERFLPQLQNIEHTEFVVAEVGKSFDSNGSRSNTDNSVLFSLHLPAEDERPVSSIDIAQHIRDTFTTFEGGKVSVLELSGGPPAGADVQIKLLGDDLGKLDGYANQIMDHLEQQPGLTNVDKSIKTGTTQLVFVPNQSQLAEAGLSADQLGLWLRTYASGFTLDSVTWLGNGTDKSDVVFKLTTDPDANGLSSLSITSMSGRSYPLSSLGHWELRPNPTQITRENGKRTISVSASSVAGYSISEQNAELLEYTKSLNLPDGYEWATGGVNDENQKSVNSILQAMVVAAILILVTMVIQFGSFRQAFIVLLVIPLAVSSVFFIFGLTGTPLSFPALIGVLSLFGVVVTNSMFIVDKINLNQREGMTLKAAIADAGASRLEPIILTKLCTVLGLLPITIADPLWRGLGGAIISGLLLSSTIMLLFIPVVYYEFFKNEAR